MKLRMLFAAAALLLWCISLLQELQFFANSGGLCLQQEVWKGGWPAAVRSGEGRSSIFDTWLVSFQLIQLCDRWLQKSMGCFGMLGVYSYDVLVCSGGGW